MLVVILVILRIEKRIKNNRFNIAIPYLNQNYGIPFGVRRSFNLLVYKIRLV